MEFLRQNIQNFLGLNTEINFNYITLGKNIPVRVKPSELLCLWLYRVNDREKDIKGINLISVTHNNTKIDIFKTIESLGIKNGDTLIIESEKCINDNEEKDKRKIRIKSNMTEIYEGEIKNGEYDGKGKLYHILGIMYEGEIKNGKMSGKGIEKLNNGEVYEGEWENGTKNGHGIWRTYDGEEYVGLWKDGKKHGKGKTEFPNGDIYEGDYKDGKGNGKGVIKWSYSNEFDEYEGDIKDDLMDGKGVLKYINGNIYEGEFKKDKREGKGIIKYKNGDIFEGEFKDGVADGIGKMIYADGKIEEGLYENDIFIGDDEKNPFIFKCIKTLNNHSDTIFYIMKLKDGRFASCSEDCTLNIYNKENYELDLSIKEHSAGILHFTQLNDGRLITCSKDKTIKIIELTNDNNYKIQSTLSHNDLIYKVIELKKNEIISISKDGTMKIWNVEDFKNILTIKYICNEILKLNENEFVTYSSADSKNIKFWGVNNFEQIETIKNIITYSMMLFEDDILAICGRFNLYLVKISNHNIIKTLEVPGIIWSLYKCLDGTFLSTVFNGFKHNNIIKYKYENEKLIKIGVQRKAHNNWIFNCIELDNGIIVSGEGDQQRDSFEIKIWEILPNDKK